MIVGCVLDDRIRSEMVFEMRKSPREVQFHMASARRLLAQEIPSLRWWGRGVLREGDQRYAQPPRQTLEAHLAMMRRPDMPRPV